MKKIIEGSDRTPVISIDTDIGLVSIKGIMIPENPISHFEIFSSQIHDLYEQMKCLKLEFELEYFNTASAKYLYDLLKSLKDKNNIEVIWRYEEDDEDILETGKEYESLTGLQFTFISF